jgi:hypothetical protein
MVRAEEIDNFKCEHLCAVVACVPEGNRQGDPSKRCRVLAQDYSIEWVWVALELVRGKAQSFKRVKVHESEATALIHEGLGEPGCPDQRVDDEGKSSWLRDAIRVVRLVKSDRGLRLVQVFRGHRAYGVDHPVDEFKLAT